MFLDAADSEEVAPSAGLVVTEHVVTSQPDGNDINIRFIRPERRELLPCVYYIHGGGMQVMSCYDGNYRAWGRMIAAQGVAVAMVDFRNALVPSSVPEVAPFPAGLNDCVSGVKWVASNHDELAIDPERIVVAGESGGGNLTLATGLKLKQDGDLGVIAGLYALCPYIAGTWPLDGEPVVDREQRHPARPAQQPRRDGLRHRGARASQSSRVAGLGDGGRRARPRPDGDQRERVRSAARRGDRFLQAAAARRRPGTLPPAHGDDPRHGDLPDDVPGDQP